jgi:uncharacterized protein
MLNLRDNEAAALRELKERLTREFNVVEMKLYGSKARGDSTPGSDVDVLIVLEDYNWEAEKAVYNLCYDVGLDRGVFIAPSLYTRPEYESSLTRSTLFYRNVAREGIRL